LELDKAKPIIDLPKFCNQNLVWGTKANQNSFLQATSALDDAEGATIPGLTIQLEVKKPILVATYHFELGLFKLSHNGIRERVYQLNVTPMHRRSHNDKKHPIYGPHIHHGCDLTFAASKSLGDDLNKAFELYCADINLSFTANLNSPL